MSVEFFGNFEKALKKLGDFCRQFDGSEIQMAGVIQAFEFTFEQCWKALQKKAGTEGVSVASPKKALEWAMACGWIATAGEAVWLQMLADRNLTSHTYREPVAREVAGRVIRDYLPAFEGLLMKMKGQ